MKFDWKTTLCLSGFSLLFVPLAQAQFCTLTNASLNGSYGYVASQSGMVGTTGTGTTGTTGTGTTGTGTTGTGTTGTGTSTGTTGTGTTGTVTTGTGATGSFSNTGTGNLIGGIGSGSLFAYSGVWIFNGAGIISASQMPGGSSTPIGTYNVNSDCSLSVSIHDAFGTSANATPTQFAGVILGHGSEIDLTAASSLTGGSSTTTGTGTTGTGTTGTGSTGTGTTGTGTTGTGTTGASSANTGAVLQIKLVHVLFNSGCSDSNLAGLYGFVLNPLPSQTSSTATTGTTGTGTGTTGTGTTGTGATGTGTSTTTGTSSAASGTVIGYIDFDGTGKVVSIASLLSSTGSSSTGTTTSGTSTFSALDYTGTYTVYPDCSGIMTINSSSNTSTTGTGTGTTGTGTTGTGSTGTGTTGTTTTGTSTSANSITINFVITPPEVPVGGLTTGAAAGSPNLVLSYSQGGTAGSGYALAQ